MGGKQIMKEGFRMLGMLVCLVFVTIAVFSAIVTDMARLNRDYKALQADKAQFMANRFKPNAWMVEAREKAFDALKEGE